MKVRKIKSRKIYQKAGYALLLIGFGAWLNSHLSPHGDNSWMMQTPSVQVQGLAQKDISAKKKYIAQVEAINSVDVMPQVSGYLEEQRFQDGAEVKTGDVLFIIEQRRYKDNLKAAEATRKQLAADYKRLQSLHSKKFISDKELEAAESALKNAEAAEDLAKLNLEYTEVKSPIDGVIGKSLVSVGNLISNQKMARIVQQNPIRITFSVTDKERSEFMEKLSEAEDVFVDVVMPNGEPATQEAKNLFFSNEVNTDTATIPVYLEFANDEDLLVPGNYVDIYMRFSSRKMALLVPQMALAEDANGTYVMTVAKQEDNTWIVKQKYIQLGDVIDDMQIVISGLEKDDKVVVQGLQKVRDGGVVNPIFVDVKQEK